MVLHGRDHRGVGEKLSHDRIVARRRHECRRAKPLSVPTVDRNEDVGAIVRGSRADLLIVADGHFGHEASELAVTTCWKRSATIPPPADLVDEELVALFFDAGVAVQRETGRPGCPHPDSRTTLALALVADDVVQWAALGDSCVVSPRATRSSPARRAAKRVSRLRFACRRCGGSLTRGRVARTSIDASSWRPTAWSTHVGVDDKNLDHGRATRAREPRGRSSTRRRVSSSSRWSTKPTTRSPSPSRATAL